MTTALTNLSTLTCEQIGAAFENAGYEGMTPRRAEYVKHNDAGSFVYRCQWFDQVEGALVEGNAYVWVDNSGAIKADC